MKLKPFLFKAFFLWRIMKKREQWCSLCCRVLSVSQVSFLDILIVIWWKNTDVLQMTSVQTSSSIDHIFSHGLTAKCETRSWRCPCFSELHRPEGSEFTPIWSRSRRAVGLFCVLHVCRKQRAAETLTTGRLAPVWRGMLEKALRWRHTSTSWQFHIDSPVGWMSRYLYMSITAF